MMRAFRAQSCTRVALRLRVERPPSRAQFHNSTSRKDDPRLSDLGHVLEHEFSTLKDKYDAPKHAIILAHGLLGFDELHLAGEKLPGIQYWRGITDALLQKGVQVITAAVPPSGSIEARAERLGEAIARRAGGKSVNIIA